MLSTNTPNAESSKQGLCSEEQWGRELNELMSSAESSNTLARLPASARLGIGARRRLAASEHRQTPHQPRKDNHCNTDHSRQIQGTTVIVNHSANPRISHTLYQQ